MADEYRLNFLYLDKPAFFGDFAKERRGGIATTTTIIIIIIIKALGIETADKWYTHMPKPVYEEGDVTVLWNQEVNTDREVTANRPDIIIKNKKEKTCTLIGVAIPADRNVVQKEAEKKLKYKSLCIEIQRMWNLKCTIIPIIIGPLE